MPDAFHVHFDRVTDAARKRNKWRVWAISQDPPRRGDAPNGAAVVERPNAPSGRPGTEWAVVKWAVRFETEVQFFAGDYDFTRDEAFARFGERAR